MPFIRTVETINFLSKKFWSCEAAAEKEEEEAVARRTEALTRQPASEQERGQDDGGKEDNSRQEAGDDERWRRWCNNQPTNKDVNNMPNPSAQHQHNNQPYKGGGKRWRQRGSQCRLLRMMVKAAPQRGGGDGDRMMDNGRQQQQQQRHNNQMLQGRGRRKTAVALLIAPLRTRASSPNILPKARDACVAEVGGMMTARRERE